MNPFDRLKSTIAEAKKELENTAIFEALTDSIIKISGRLDSLTKSTTEGFQRAYKGLQEVFERVVGIETRVEKIEKLKLKDGYTPRKGIDYVDGKDGADGIDGKNGLDGKDGKDGQNGKDGKRGEKGEKGEKGGDGITTLQTVLKEVPLLPIEIKGKLETLKGDERLDAKAIKNLPSGIQRIGSNGLRKFIELDDTPKTYKGKAGQVVKVATNEKGLVFGAGGSGEGTTDHSALDNLAYANSGHTGFQPAGEYLTANDLPEVPSDISDLTDNTGIIPLDTGDLTNNAGFITSNDIPAIPTKTSDLENDSGFIDTQYSLPIASDTVLGGIKVGSRLTMDQNGVLSADVQSGGSGIQSIVAGTDISVDATDPANPIVSFDGTIPTELDATNINITDSGDYYTGEDVEVALQEIGEKFDDMFEPTGFVNRTSSTITFTNTSPDRTLTITPNTSFDIYESGVKYTKTVAESVPISDVTGIHVVYYDEGVLTEMANPTDAQNSLVIRTKPIVSYLYWNSTDGEAIYIGEERHGIQMDGNTHAYLHFTEGLRYISGLGLNSIVIGNGSSNTHAQFGVDIGDVTDEDIYDLIQPVLYTTGLPIYYMLGDEEWSRDVVSGYSVTKTGTVGEDRLAYNFLNGASWELKEVTDGDYVLCHVFATTEKDKPMIAVMGQNEYNNVVNARTGADTEIRNLVLSELPLPEIRPIATLIFQTNDSYANAMKAKIVTTADGNNYVDWRDDSISRVELSTTDHNSLTGKQGGTLGEYYHLTAAQQATVAELDGFGTYTDQAALQSIDLENRQLMSNTESGPIVLNWENGQVKIASGASRSAYTIIDNANSSDRTVTFPDKDGTVAMLDDVGLSQAQVLTRTI